MSISPVIVALDYVSTDEALAMARQLSPEKVRVKVGKELFTRAGPAVVAQLQGLGFDVFLDLKFHDIPNTVAGAIKAAADLGVWMVNVHASGGGAMMEAARAALDGYRQRPLLTAVTVLTSMDDAALREIGVEVPVQQHVQRLAHLADSAGLDGVVCSAREASLLRSVLGEKFCLVTPGIRPTGATSGDQSRVVTPGQARDAGVDYMVIGRPITRAREPDRAVEEILRSLSLV